MTYADMFSKVKSELIGADVSNIQEHLAYQFNITGEAAGIFYVEVKEGTLYVEPYEYFDRDVIFTCTVETLEKIASGALDPVEAFTKGQLQVEGNFEKALKLKDILLTCKRETSKQEEPKPVKIKKQPEPKKKRR